MNIALSTAAFFPRDINESIDLANSAGIKTIELMPQDLSECSVEFAKEIKRIDRDIRVYSIHFPLILLPFIFNPHPRAQKTGKEITRNVIAMAEELNTQIIVMHSPRIEKGTPVFRSVSTEHIRYMCDLAAGKGIKIAIENNPGSETSHPDGLLSYIREIDKDNLTTVIDTTESMEAGINPIEFLSEIPDVGHLHLSDFSEQGKHLPLGKGTINWEKLVSLMKSKNYRGQCVIELSFRHLIKNAEQTLKESVDYLDRLINN